MSFINTSILNISGAGATLGSRHNQPVGGDQLLGHPVHVLRLRVQQPGRCPVQRPERATIATDYNISDGSRFNNQGTFASAAGGTVTVGVNFINSGTVNPGGLGAAGAIAITANYTQGASGVLNIDIGGLTAGSEFDQLNVSGTATLGGTLNVGLIQPFLPAAGDSFKIMTFGSRSPADSDFATYNGLNLPNGLVFTPVYHPADLTLTILGTPSINTSQQPASATVGSSIADQATVSGGYNPTGTVTFNLYNNPTGDRHAPVHRHRDALRRHGHLDGLHRHRDGHRLLGRHLQRRLATTPRSPAAPPPSR